MRLLVLFFALFAADCTSIDSRPYSLNDMARDYVHLTLEIGAHEEGYIDAYFGPPEWKDQADTNPRTVDALKREADRIHAALGAVDVGALQTSERHRVVWLSSHVASARFRLDMIGGTRLPFGDEAYRLFAVRPDLRPLESYDPVLVRIEAMVPGDGPLAARVEDFRNRHLIPSDRLGAVMVAAIDECRRRTAAHLQLPEGEQFGLEFVTDKNWSAYNWYQGNNQSLIQINTDLPIAIDSALRLGCHEGYPGHHVQGMHVERKYRERGWVEFSVLPLYAPPSPLMEGGADFGVDLAFPGAERANFEAAMLYKLAGLDSTTAAAYDAVREALADLAGARLTIAAMYLDGDIDHARALELSQHYLLISRARAEQSLAFTEDYRSYVINYVSGEDLVRDFVEQVGRSEAERWAAFERIFSDAMLPDELAP